MFVVTGSAGCIGGAIRERMEADGHTVIGAFSRLWCTETVRQGLENGVTSWR
ncbi:MAG: NAD(P)-dependent oxidoreductase [Actinobacteria bacterium]|nr:NAD(P)-dependent oxidoreductase [Actinomycetota bacterium]